MSIAIGNTMIAGNARILYPNTVSNPNLLINSNFKINTKAKESYSEADIECVNKWFVTKSSADVSYTATPIDRGLRVIVSGRNDSFVSFSQVLTRPIDVETSFSMSFKSEDTDLVWDAFVNDGIHKSYLYQRIVTQIGPRMIYDPTKNEVTIRVYNGETLNMSYVKIEHGENGTMYVDPDPALEIIRCNSEAGGDVTYDQSTSKPNLIINPDMWINQREDKIYDHTGYTVDRWYTNGCRILSNASNTELDFPRRLRFGMGGMIVQYVEKLSAGNYTLSVKLTCSSGVRMVISGPNIGVTKECASGLNMVGFNVPETTENLIYVGLTTSSEATATIEYFKLEAGTSATLYTAPDPALETLKCQRYYQTSKDRWDMDHHDLRPLMRVPVTGTATDHGFYYEGEIYPPDN